MICVYYSLVFHYYIIVFQANTNTVKNFIHTAIAVFANYSIISLLPLTYEHILQRSGGLGSVGTVSDCIVCHT